MSVKQHYNCIIVGAGPAGISCAIHLRRQSAALSILVVEKRVFPREKLCVGYITRKTVSLFEELGLDVTSIGYTLVKGLSVFYKDRARLHMKNHGLYCHAHVDRTALDDAFFGVLRGQNIDILQNAALTGVLEQKRTACINGEDYSFDHLVLADGALGYSQKYNAERKRYFAMQMNFPSTCAPAIEMYLGVAKRGYAWRASSGAYVNIGFCDIYDKTVDYTSLFSSFAQKLGYEAQGAKGFFVPFGLKQRPVVGDAIYLAGDAAGAVDPLTLAGISYALLCGKSIARSIAAENSAIYLRYLKKLRRKFSVLAAMAGMLYTKPFLFLVIRAGGRFFGPTFSWLLDHFILNKTGSLHD